MWFKRTHSKIPQEEQKKNSKEMHTIEKIV